MRGRVKGRRGSALAGFLLLLTAAFLLPADAGAQPAPQLVVEEGDEATLVDGMEVYGLDRSEVHALFQKNLAAIRERDREAYLDCYLRSEGLVRNGPGGMALGYDELADATGTAWPDAIDAQDLQVQRIAPDVYYGSYRYRVRYGTDEQSGISERVFVKTEDGWKIAATTAFETLPGVPPPPLALTGATLVDGTGGPPVPEATVIVRGGRIDCAGPAAECPVPSGIRTLHLEGSFITPGLIDAHVHFSQTAWADGRPDAVDVRPSYPYAEVQARLRTHPEAFQRAYLCSGVTSVFDVGGYAWTLDLADEAENDTLSPRIGAAGPLLSTLDFWLNLPAERQFIHLEDEETGREGAAYLAARGADAVKVWFINRPEGDGGTASLEEMARAVAAAGEEARSRGLPLIVHATGLAEAKEAVRAGAHLLVHSVWDREVDDELIRLMKEKGTVYNPTLVVGRGYQRLREAIAAGTAPTMDDPAGCVDAGTRARLAETAGLAASLPGVVRSEEALARGRQSLAAREATAAANLARVAAAGIPIAMGTDAGNPLTLHGVSVHEEMRAMAEAGLTPMEVLVASTQGGAKALGREDELGTVEAGKLADLLILTADPTRSPAAFRSLLYVMRGGELRTPADLAPEGLR